MNIWKFPLEVRDIQRLYMPPGAKILAVQTQGDMPCIWALIEQRNLSPEERVFRVVGTGHDFDGKGDYIGTFQMARGALVFHVFEVVS